MNTMKPINPFVAYARNLRQAADTVVRSAQRDYKPTGRESELINEDRIRCVEAGIMITETGEERYVMTISEASPEAYEFREWLRQKMEFLGFENVEIRMEW